MSRTPINESLVHSSLQSEDESGSVVVKLLSQLRPHIRAVVREALIQETAQEAAKATTSPAVALLRDLLATDELRAMLKPNEVVSSLRNAFKTEIPLPSDEEIDAHSQDWLETIAFSWVEWLRREIELSSEVNLGDDLLPEASPDVVFVSHWETSLAPFAPSVSSAREVLRLLAKNVLTKGRTKLSEHIFVECLPSGGWIAGAFDARGERDAEGQRSGLRLRDEMANHEAQSPSALGSATRRK